VTPAPSATLAPGGSFPFQLPEQGDEIACAQQEPQAPAQLARSRPANGASSAPAPEYAQTSRCARCRRRRARPGQSAAQRGLPQTRAAAPPAARAPPVAACARPARQHRGRDSGEHVARPCRGHPRIPVAADRVRALGIRDHRPWRPSGPRRPRNAARRGGGADAVRLDVLHLLAGEPRELSGGGVRSGLTGARLSHSAIRSRCSERALSASASRPSRTLARARPSNSAMVADVSGPAQSPGRRPGHSFPSLLHGAPPDRRSPGVRRPATGIPSLRGRPEERPAAPRAAPPGSRARRPARSGCLDHERRGSTFPRRTRHRQERAEVVLVRGRLPRSEQRAAPTPRRAARKAGLEAILEHARDADGRDDDPAPPIPPPGTGRDPASASAGSRSRPRGPRWTG